MNRRRFLATSMSTAVLGALRQQVAAQSLVRTSTATLGRLKKIGVAGRALLGANLTLEEQCQRAQQVGITGFDFADIPSEWPTMKRHGIVCSMRRLSDPMAPAGARVGTGRPGWNEIGRKEAQGEFGRPGASRT
jgi:hypothetical protein